MPTLFLEAYQDLPISTEKGQGAKAKSKIPFPCDVTILISLAKLANADASQLNVLLDRLGIQLRYFKRQSSEMMIKTLISEGMLFQVSQKAQDTFDICTRMAPARNWSLDQNITWLGIQTLRSNPGTLLALYQSTNTPQCNRIKKRARLLFEAIQGSTSIKPLLDTVINIPAHVSEFLDRAGVGSQVSCLTDSTSCTSPNPFQERLAEIHGTDTAKQMQNLCAMMCRNARLTQDTLNGVHLPLQQHIANIFGISEMQLQQVLLSAFVDCSFKRWRDALPKLVEVMMQNHSEQESGQSSSYHANANVCIVL